MSSKLLEEIKNFLFIVACEIDDDDLKDEIFDLTQKIEKEVGN